MGLICPHEHLIKTLSSNTVSFESRLENVMQIKQALYIFWPTIIVLTWLLV